MPSHLSQYGKLWTREESILAFYLYCRIPFRKTKANNPEVCKLAKLLNRSPAAVARKLGNFGSFDPELRSRGITGLPNAGAIAAQVWNEFHNDWNRLVSEAQALQSQFALEARVLVDNLEIPSGPSERITTKKERLHQSFFRTAVLSSYLDACCVTGISIVECLIASHIVPWSKDEKLRTDPTNGLCLSATCDRLFDNGLITVDRNLSIVVSRRIRESDSPTNRRHVAEYHGKPIKRPHRFMPSQAHLDWHRRHVFRDA